MDRQRALYLAVGCELVGLTSMLLLTRAVQMPFSLAFWITGLVLLISELVLWFRYRN